MVDTPLLLDWQQVEARTKFGRTKIFKMMKSGELESIKVGKYRRVPADALTDLIDRLRREQSREAA